MESFQELGLPEFLQNSLKQMNFMKPTEVQAQAIPAGLAGKDVIASAQTGTGKTAAFGIPLLTYLEKNKDKTALILTPTRELAVQVLEVLRKLTGTHHVGGSVLLIGGANMSTQFSQLTRKPRLIIGTPGRVIDHLNRGSLSLSANGFLVLDEADRMLDMGFAPQLDEIRKKLIGHRQTLLFSATIPPNIQQMASKYLKDPIRITIGSGTQPIQKIAQKVLYTTEAKKPEELSGELKERQGSILIFARTQHRVDRIMNRLKEEGVKVTRIHGGRSQSQRKQAIDQFREGKFLILVATDIAARGLDIHHIAHVINYDLPRNPEDYIHRVGRTARAGAEGEALCFLTPEDRELWQRILKLMGVNSQSIPVKPSRFGFTAPREDASPRPHSGRPAPHGRPPQRHDRPQGGRPSGRPQGHGAPHPSHSRPPQRSHEGQGFQGGHREAPSRDFAPRNRFEGGAGDAPRKNRRPDGRHQQRSEMHHRKFGASQGGFPDKQAEFNEADEKQPMSNESRNWGKPVGFMQALGRKFMGGDRSRPAKGGFSRDGRPGGFRKEGGFGGGDHRRPQGPRPHRFDNSSGGPRPFSNDRRPHSDSRPGGHREGNRFGHSRPGAGAPGEHRSEGGRPHRPGGGFHPKGGFRKSGSGNSRPGGFRPR